MTLRSTSTPTDACYVFTKIAQLKDIATFRAYLAEIDGEVPLDDEILTAAAGSPLAEPCQFGSLTVGNRWCIHPMEGWDANADGSPSDLTLRRWHNFGLSGAKLIWGGEAAAVQEDGRANPHQTLATEENRHGLGQLLKTLQDAHDEKFGTLDGLVVGLQLTHSGRFSRPWSKDLAPRIAYHHPLLDAKFGIDPDDESIVWTDADLEKLIERYVIAAQIAAYLGYHFVDVKACHGYLLHEFLSARHRPGPFGGDFNGRTRLMRTIIERVRATVPDLHIGVRLSVFDIPPYRTSREVGEPLEFAHLLPYELGFGCRADDPMQMDLTETVQLLHILRDLGVAAVNVSCGSPYYNPHVQRPAAFPPSDGYLPPEDPLRGVCRQLQAARQCKVAVPELLMVGSGYSYLQDYLPHVAQAVVRAGWIDSVGLGRMVLSYPELPADTLQLGAMARKKVCRTFSDCTTAPRNGLVSGCYPLDPHYKAMPESQEVIQIKKAQREG